MKNEKVKMLTITTVLIAIVFFTTYKVTNDSLSTIRLSLYGFVVVFCLLGIFLIFKK